ncbi:MAG: transcription termination/antitermination protein NusA [Myxococcales bacterium]|jgi:N utilization substance protein A|nr:transcription termination/antitermination protein NusA [Myxococcales bacterium]
MQDGILSLHMILDQVSRDKGINKTVLIEAIEAAILTAAKKNFGASKELEARFNEETGIVDLFQYMLVVDDVTDPAREISLEDAAKAKLETSLGEELGFQIFYRDEDEKKAAKQDKEYGELLGMKTAGRGFGRIAAQTAKQVITQRVRDAERENIYNEYKDRKDEVIAGVVRRFERNNNIIVDLGRTEAVIPAREQAPRESYRLGDRVMAYVKDIDKEAKGSQIVLSRTHPGLLKKLFEMEVPEIYEGIVSIVAVAREPGARAKIAVASRDADVDPVGACVGMRGSRVQAVVQELRGEKIDIVPWDPDPARFVCNAIQPAEVSRVIIDDANGAMELVVPDDKLSLAIGRRGQNVRLASQLTNWKLDVISESKIEERERISIASLARLEGVDENMARMLYKLGFRSLEEIADADVAELRAIPGMGDDAQIQALQQRAETFLERRRKRQIRGLLRRGGKLEDRDRMMFVRGVGDRTIELLTFSGYRTVEELANEADLDRLALSTGLGIRKARMLLEGAQSFLNSEEQIIEQIRQEAIAAAAEDEAEEAKEAEALAAATASPEAEETVDGEVADGEVADGEVADGEVADGEVADGEVADGEVADGEAVPTETDED